MQTSSLRYRPDIDGLRAVAVLSVLFFHLGSKLFSGGFVGVDVFFVISGFLITGVVLQRIEASSFSFADFYSRRIRRIFPSLLALFAFALALGWFVLFNSEYVDLGKRVFYGSVFYSNLYELRQSGYFNQFSELKSLLQLWSLGVEEQFYLAWPIVLVLFRGRTRAWVVAGLVLASFIFNLVAVRISREAAFYLPISRFWELAAGCILAFQVRENGAEPAGTGANIRSMIGVALILAGVFLFDRESLFPGWRALLPVGGAYLVIAAGKDAWINRIVLSHPIAIFFGLISYPLYLWHWTLLYFVRVMEAGDPSRGLLAGTVALSIGLAWICYRFIEKPIRHSQWKGTAAGLFAANALFCVISLGVLKVGNHREYQATASATNAWAASVVPCPNRAEGHQCLTDAREPAVYALIGDSHALSLYPGLVRTSRPGGRWMCDFRLSCPPIMGGPGDDDCARSNDEAIQEVESNPRVRLVLIAGAERLLSRKAAAFLTDEINITKLSPDEVLEGLSRTIRSLYSAHKEVAFLVDDPAITSFPQFCLPRPVSISAPHRISPNCSISRAAYDAATGEYRSIIQKLKDRFPQLILFDPTDVFCDQDRCSVVRKGEIYYVGSDHMSEFASEIVGRRITEWLSSRHM